MPLIAMEPPEVVVVEPTEEHKHTFILLHGRGDNAPSFQAGLLRTRIKRVGTLALAFPHAKFIFPTASKRAAVALGGYAINQWFDMWTLDPPTDRGKIQVEGLLEISVYVHELLRQEIAVVGAKNVVLGGLSQGCASSLVALLTWDGEPLAAAVGMCGWLPFHLAMKDMAQQENLAETDEQKKRSPAMQAVNYLRKELTLPTLAPDQQMSFQKTPLFLSHGAQDPKVFVEYGKVAGTCLQDLGMQVEWDVQEGLGHWYSDKMLQKVVQFSRRYLDSGEHAMQITSKTAATPTAV